VKEEQEKQEEHAFRGRYRGKAYWYDYSCGGGSEDGNGEG
jgi:hypothetical protein